MRLSSCNLFIYSLQILAASLVTKVAAFAEDQDPLPFNEDQTKGTQVGDVYEVNISSTYDESDIKAITSEDGKTDTYTLTYANASYISVHFRQFDLPSSCLLEIKDSSEEVEEEEEEEEEQSAYTLTGQGKFNLGTFWAHHVNGDTMELSLSCDEEEDKELALFEIDQFAAGFPLNNDPDTHSNNGERHLRLRTTKEIGSIVEEKETPSLFLKAIDDERKLSICGKDDKRNAICYKKSESTIYNKAKAVARLLINGRFACTGWLVSKGSLLFTNEHCIDSLSDVQNTDFEFMGEESRCAIGSSDGSWFSSRNRDGIHDGTALLKKSATWDYALVQLSGNPASKYGFLELDNRKAGVNEQIYIPQHPGGRPKEIGVFDSNHNGNCKVKGYRRGCAPEDMTYSCDTEGGSSGSPVLSRTNNKVVALHHCGGGCNGNMGAPIYKFYSEIKGLINAPVTPNPSKCVWGVNSSDSIYYKQGKSGNWQRIGGTLKQVSVSNDCNHVWGVNSSDNIYYRAGVNGTWQQIPGKLKQVSVSDNGKHIWGVNSSDNNIYYRAGVSGTWQQIGGKLKQVSVSKDGMHVWGVNSSDNIYYRAGINGTWQQIGGKLKHVSVNSDGTHVWGVNSNSNIYYRAGVNGTWQYIPGKLKQVSVSKDGKYVWGVNASDNIYFRLGKNGSWTQIGGKLKYVSVGDDDVPDDVAMDVWGVNSSDNIYYRGSIYGTWQQIGGKLKHVSVSKDGNHVWGVNSNNYIYYRAGKNGTWQRIVGSLKQVSVSDGGTHVWGVNSSDNIYYRAGVNGRWQQIGGKLKYVSVSDDGNHIWGVNSSDNIYYRAGVNGIWQQIPGKLKQVSVSKDGSHVWGVNSNNNIYYRAGKNGTWQQIGGKLKYVSVSDDGSNVWGVNSNNNIYRRAGKNGTWQQIGGKLKQISIA